MQKKAVVLWDPWVRIFHWSLVFMVAANYAFNESGELWHRALGGTALALVALRIIWGFVANNRAARWQDFFPTPKRLFVHVKALCTGKPYHRLGHTPIGALVMILMLLCVCTLGITGLMMTATDAFELEEWIADLHVFVADALIALVAVHVFAAVLESWRMKENLPLSMVTGKRRSIDE